MKNYVKAFSSMVFKKLKSQVGDAGVGYVIIIIVSIIIAAFVFLPGLRAFGGSIITAMNNWWTTTMQGTIFVTN